jgi:hypothetical protein
LIFDGIVALSSVELELRRGTADVLRHLGDPLQLLLRELKPSSSLAEQDMP